MSIVNLASGGLDSTLVGVMIKESGIAQFPLFVDYGQIAGLREWTTSQLVHERLELPAPTRMDISGFGQVIASGLTRRELDVRSNAFTPGRNLLFLLMGSAFAFQEGASTVAIGLLSEEFSQFPDQKATFISQAEETIAAALGRRIRIVTPLAEFSKADVVKLAAAKGITGTYSCHTGATDPCGKCIACLEYQQ
ncbi:7-cyano-7-deazaguanine synthase [Paraburkholderia youngii]|uniref:7-cyano-7-deazaguanine synthase n=1 Tax=Paraburkholderia youngii TaxID=2782701 RepID=UPI003D251B02